MTTTTPTTALADLELQHPIKDTQEAREYVDAWHRENFPTDRTFSRYILGTQGDRSKLAGDFAWQLANALARRAAQPAEGAAPVEQFASDLAARQVELPADFANVLANMPYEEEPAEGAGQAGQVARLQKAYDIMHHALCEIAQPADEGRSHKADADDMRETAVDALCEAESVIDFGQTVAERAAAPAEQPSAQVKP